MFHEMEDKTLGNNIVIYNILIDGLCNVGNLTVVRELFYSLPVKGLQPNVRTYTITLKGLCKEGLIEEACVFEKMDGSSFSPNNHTYNTIIQGLVQHNETPEAMEYLEIMVDKGFLANVIVVSMLFDLLNIQEFPQKLV